MIGSKDARGRRTKAVQPTGIKRTIGSFIQKWGIDLEEVTEFVLAFNDFGDKRTDGCILKASFVDHEGLKRFYLGAKPDLDKQPIVV
jgi:hypothetical protein